MARDPGRSLPQGGRAAPRPVQDSPIRIHARHRVGPIGQPKEILTAQGPRSTEANGVARPRSDLRWRRSRRRQSPHGLPIAALRLPLPGQAAPAGRPEGTKRADLPYYASGEAATGGPAALLRGWRGDGRPARRRRRLTSPNRGAPPQPPPELGGRRGWPPGALPDG